MRLHRSELPGAVRSRLATGGLAVVLVGLTAFGIGVAITNSDTARSVIRTNRASQSFERARFFVSEAESLERKYRLEPGQDVSRRFDEAAAGLAAALHTARRDAASDQVPVIDRALELHDRFVKATHEMFAAIDANDLVTALRIDGSEMDPIFDQIRDLVNQGADRGHNRAVSDLQTLRREQSRVLVTTPIVFAFALGLVGLAAGVIRRYRSEVDHMALHDALTGLPNRRLLADRGTQALLGARRAGRDVAVLLLDLDHFKELNDTLGHAHGDRLLAEIGPRLQRVLRASDTVARLGGDEFVVLLGDTAGPEAALAVADKLLGALTEPFQVAGLSYVIEGSIGVAVAPHHGDNIESLVRRADIAMYVAKETHTRIALYHADLDRRDPASLALLGELRDAIEGDQLVLHYQPKCALPSGELAGVEALVRWQHPTRGLLMPVDFIPFAEQTTLIGPLTEAVLRLALAQSRTWSEAGRDVPIAVNLSPRCLLDRGLIDDIGRALVDAGVPGRLLQLEVTESAIMVDPLRAHEMLARLAEMGIEIAIDDFGTGYSSLAYLKALPVHELKIDRSFVTQMRLDPNDAVIVHAVIELAHSLGLRVIAEGVEDPDTNDDLTRAHCDLAQGYYWSRPVPAEQLDGWVASSAGPCPGHSWSGPRPSVSAVIDSEP